MTALVTPKPIPFRRTARDILTRTGSGLKQQAKEFGEIGLKMGLSYGCFVGFLTAGIKTFNGNLSGPISFVDQIVYIAGWGACIGGGLFGFIGTGSGAYKACRYGPGKAYGLNDDITQWSVEKAFSAYLQAPPQSEDAAFEWPNQLDSLFSSFQRHAPDSEIKALQKSLAAHVGAVLEGDLARPDEISTPWPMMRAFYTAVFVDKMSGVLSACPPDKLALWLDREMNRKDSPVFHLTTGPTGLETSPASDASPSKYYAAVLRALGKDDPGCFYVELMKRAGENKKAFAPLLDALTSERLERSCQRAVLDQLPSLLTHEKLKKKGRNPEAAVQERASEMLEDILKAAHPRHRPNADYKAAVTRALAL